MKQPLLSSQLSHKASAGENSDVEDLTKSLDSLHLGSGADEWIKKHRRYETLAGTSQYNELEPQLSSTAAGDETEQSFSRVVNPTQEYEKHGSPAGPYYHGETDWENHGLFV